MKGDLPQKKPVHADGIRYVVYVLWLHGSTQEAIGKAVGLRKGQVAGIVTRSDYSNRSILTLKQRAAFLKELLEIRRSPEDGSLLDGGRLPSIVFSPRGIK